MITHYHHEKIDFNKLIKFDVDELINVLHEFERIKIHPLYVSSMSIEILINTNEFNYLNGNNKLVNYFTQSIFPKVKRASSYNLFIRPSKWIHEHQVSVCLGANLTDTGSQKVMYQEQIITWLNEESVSIDEQLMAHHNIFFEKPFNINVNKHGHFTYSSNTDPNMLEHFSIKA
jgi:hypothetical protein